MQAVLQLVELYREFGQLFALLVFAALCKRGVAGVDLGELELAVAVDAVGFEAGHLVFAPSCWGRGKARASLAIDQARGAINPIRLRRRRWRSSAHPTRPRRDHPAAGAAAWSGALVRSPVPARCRPGGAARAPPT